LVDEFTIKRGKTDREETGLVLPVDEIDPKMYFLYTTYRRGIA